MGEEGRSIRQQFEEIDVKRINVVGEDGRVRLVIANKERLPDPIIDGKSLPRSGPPTPGLIFYNDEGDECGGLIFGGGRQPDGSYSVGAAMMFDRYKHDQTLSLQYIEEDGRSVYGLRIWDRPEIPITETEFFRKRQAIQRMEEGPEREKALVELQEAEAEAAAKGDLGVTRVFLGRNRAGEAILSLADRKGRERIRVVVGADDVPKLEFLDERGEVVYRLPPDR